MLPPDPRRGRPRMTLLKRRLLAATLLGLAVRLAAVAVWPVAPARDAAEYHALAVGLLHGDGYVRADGTPTAFRPPGLPFLLAAVYAVAGPWPGAARVVLAVVGS